MKKLCFLLILALMLSLGASAFADNGVEIIVMDGIPVAVESFGLEVGDTAAFNAAGEGITLPAALVTIEEEAFAGMPIQGVIIPDGCTTIGSRAFAGCANLVYVKIPSTVTTIAADAFDGCPNVRIVTAD